MALYKIWASRVNNAEAAEFDGDLGQIWYDETTGNLRLYTGAPGGQIINESGGGGNAALPLSNGTSNFNIATANGNATITVAGTSTWTFDVAGNLTLPGNNFAVNYANGTAVNIGSNYSDSNVTTLLASLGSNILSSAANITTTANISADYVLGNGRFLTGIATSGGGLANGTSNIEIPVENGNAVVTIGGFANSAVFGVNSLAIGGVFSTPKIINSNVQVADAVNAVAISPLTIGELGNIFVPDDSTFTIFTPA